METAILLDTPRSAALGRCPGGAETLERCAVPENTSTPRLRGPGRNAWCPGCEFGVVPPPGTLPKAPPSCTENVTSCIHLIWVQALVQMGLSWMAALGLLLWEGHWGSWLGLLQGRCSLFPLRRHCREALCPLLRWSQES